MRYLVHRRVCAIVLIALFICACAWQDARTPFAADDATQTEGAFITNGYFFNIYRGSDALSASAHMARARLPGTAAITPRPGLREGVHCGETETGLSRAGRPAVMALNMGGHAPPIAHAAYPIS